MTEVNNINNIAREIVSNLDKKDGNADGKIEASIWNKFVCKKEGNEINNYIKTDNAIKSVIAYLKRETAKTGQAIEDVANEWLGKKEVNPVDIYGENSKLKSGSVGIPAMVVKAENDGVSDEANKRFQQHVNESLQLVSDIANGKYRYKISTQADGTKKIIELKDGRKIKVGFETDKEGKFKIGWIDIYTGGKNYNGNENHVEFDGDDGSDSILCQSSFKNGQDLEVCDAKPSSDEINELFVVINQILEKEM